MSISDLAKDTIRVAQTAGLGKDVIDLLTQKVTLLDEQLGHTTLSLEKALVRISDLEAENRNLQNQLDNRGPSMERLGDELDQILNFLSDEQPKSRDQISTATRLLSAELSVMLTTLESGGYVRVAQRGAVRVVSALDRDRPPLSPTLYRITPKGSYYLGANQREHDVGGNAIERV